MPQLPLANVLRSLRRLAEPAAVDDVPDRELLRRFAAGQDEAAFETLLRRHGPMVLNLCRCILHDSHAAEDAFQATFLVLARKASSIQKHDSLASWLYGVAHRVARRAKTTAVRQRLQERQVPSMRLSEASPDLLRQEAGAVLHEELERLPEKYRRPLVLCYLEGKSNETAARELGWPRGSIAFRLNHGRDLLRERLAHRGLALSASAFGAALTAGTADAALPAALTTSTLRAALQFAAAPLPTPAAHLAEGVLHTMSLTRLKIMSTVLLIVTLLTSGTGWLAYHAFANRLSAEPPVALPADPQTVILLWQTSGIPDPQPRLEVRADGTVTAHDLHGSPTAQLVPDELQALLRFVVREQGFFALDSRALTAEVAAQRSSVDVASTTRICLTADGREHEVCCPDPARHEQTSAAIARVRAVERRLEHLEAWTLAGGRSGVAVALRQANDAVARQFADAPPLTADDLQAARRLGDGRVTMTFERRAVARDRDPYSFVYALLEQTPDGAPKVTVKANLAPAAAAAVAEKLPDGPIDCEPKPIAGDPTVKYDFDIVYVRVPRKVPSHWAEVLFPHRMDPGGDLMILHPDGSEELLVAGGPDGSIADPAVSFDGHWVYYTHFRALSKASHVHASPEGADIYKVHVKSRKVVRLTGQTYTPNTGAAAWSADYRTPEKGKRSLQSGVLNLGPCPVPGGKVVFTSNRNAYVPPVQAVGPNTLQLFVMDDDGSNVEQIGHMNLGMALHPVVLKDGRVMFSSLEHQGLRGNLSWGLWSIHPDGTNWGPLISAFHTDTFHLQTQLSDGHIVAETYYNLSNMGFGSYVKLPANPPEGMPAFYSANRECAPRMRYLSWVSNPLSQMHFQPYGMESLTRFCSDFDAPSDPNTRGKDRERWDGPRLGKVTHPAAAPDNHLLTVWSPGRVKSGDPVFDSGIYLIKGGQPVNGPGEMLLIKNDPKYNEQWPRALVSYQRIYGIPEPKTLPAVRNDGKLSKHLPEGTPYGLVGTSSFYKRESYPNGIVPPGSVTAIDPAGATLASWLRHDTNTNWGVQGADAGLYENRDIWGVRIVALEPTTDRGGRRFFSHAKSERMRILGEIPLRKYRDGKQPIDPDGNPDTSFLAKIPADVAWTFQTIDKHGMVLNMAQTWHQLRPGEIRTDCGGGHAHSQKPTEFKDTAAARADYQVFDLTGAAPLLVSKKEDQSGKQWDDNGETGLRHHAGVKNVEYHRDIVPILQKSCVACHTKNSPEPAADLVLDDDTPIRTDEAGTLPGTYYRLAMHRQGIGKPNLFGRRSPRGDTWGSHQPTRYIMKLQARRSLLAWKLHGARLDGFHDEDFTIEAVPGDRTTLNYKGRVVDAKTWTFQDNPKVQAPPFSISYSGSEMPPPEAVAGTYVGPDGKKIKVAPLTDEDRRTIVRWIDLGCPVDLDYDPAAPQGRGVGWMLDDQRPTLALPYPQPGANGPLTKLVIGMHDYYSGLDLSSFQVVADCPVDGVPAGTNLASKFKALGDSRWELQLAQPIANLPKGKLTVSVKDRQGNITCIERTFSVLK